MGGVNETDADVLIPDVWIEDRDWVALQPGEWQKCRFLRCKKDAVAALYRGNKRPGWWCYCPKHMYARQIIDGKVMIAVPHDSPAAQRGYFCIQTKDGAPPRVK